MNMKGNSWKWAGVWGWPFLFGLVVGWLAMLCLEIRLSAMELFLPLPVGSSVIEKADMYSFLASNPFGLTPMSGSSLTSVSRPLNLIKPVPNEPKGIEYGPGEWETPSIRTIRLRPGSEEQGLQVQWISRDSPWFALGMRKGDFLLEVNGVVITNVTHIQLLEKAIEEVFHGKPIVLLLRREGQPVLLQFKSTPE